MQNSKRQIALISVLALLLYLVPNLVQDVHRVLGHHEYRNNSSFKDGKQLSNHYDKCAVCVFEFNVVDQLDNTIYVPYLKTETFLFTSLQEDQVQKNTFHYYNLRGPPKV